MQGAEERRRLMSRLGSESISPLGAVLKCAAGVLVLVVIAAGPWAFLSASGPTAAIGEHPATRADTTLAESKRIFDERRRAYESARQGNVADQITSTSERLAIE